MKTIKNNSPLWGWGALLLLLFLPSVVNAAVKLPQLFQSGMVLQRNQLVPIWGTADANETVKITFRGKSYTTTAGANGKWRIDLPKQKHGGPFEMKINDITLTDVLVGDVWIVSGQSNIDTNIERIYPRYKKRCLYKRPDPRIPSADRLLR